MEYVEIGGVHAAIEDVIAARSILESAPGVMVRQPLQRAGNPLADMDYHGISRDVLARHPDMQFEPGTHSLPTAHVKMRVIHYLAMDCSLCGW